MASGANMIYRKLTVDGQFFMRHENDGDLDHGHLFVDEQGYVRWISVEDVMKMKSDGNYSGATGYPAYHE